MIAISILSIILVTSVIFCSLYRIPSRSYQNIYSKSIIFVHPADAKHFGNLFSIGDAESIQRIMKALQKRRNIEIIEMDEEIYVINHNPASVDNFRTVPRGLFVSDYDPIEDLRNLRSSNIGFQHVNPDTNRYVTGYKTVPINKLEEITDDFFVSDFDLIGTLRNLSTPDPVVLASQTPS